MKKKIVVIIIFISMTGIFCKEDKSAFIVPEGYKNWKKPVNRVLDYTVPGHGAGFRIIYANEISFQARITLDKNNIERVVVPDGAVIVKEIYKKRKDINKADPILTIMVKDSENKDAKDGWLYYMIPPGKDAKMIKGKMCHGCHEAANDEHPYFDKNKNRIFRDYLFAPFVK